MFWRPVLALILSTVCTLHVLCEEIPKKRLLLNDPSVVDQRLTHAESVIQQLQTLTQQLTGKVSSLESTISQLQHQTANQALTQQLIGKVSSLESTISQLQHQTSSQGSSSLYVHWGRGNCANKTASLVYSGYAAGGIYKDTGAGSEYICLPDDPIYGSKSRTLSSPESNVYGAEYNGGSSAWGDHSAYQDAPCAVCRSHESTALMIPGRNMCYTGWTMQYKGYLASSFYNHAAQYNYVCVDEHAEYLPGGSRTDYGALFYPVVGKCGSLKCPPYKDSQYLTCVVCTK